ncbi:MAG: hypothetical protein J6B43_06210 [Lachnospiraceae bacterium]|nr:hypothetical protein [Lachnospiraceae bacterium]
MGKKKGVIIALLAAMTLLFTVACGKQEETPADADTIASVEEVTGTEESEESQEASAEESSEAPEEEKEEVKLSGDYLAEIAEGEMLEFAYSDYNSDYVVGNKITISVTMESASGFNGSIGCCVGSSYDWNQEEFAFEAGSGTLTWTVTPSVDSAQLNL